MIRDFQPGDAEGISEILHEEEPPHPLTPAGVLHWITARPERAKAHMWVAAEEGRIVGWAEACLRWTTSVQGIGDVWAFVRPADRGRGLGGALLDQAQRYARDVGARILESWTYTEAGERLLEANGFRSGEKERVSRLDPVEADTSPLAALADLKAAEGFGLVPLRDVHERATELHRVYAAASADIPEYFREDDVRPDEWRRETLEHPQLSLDGSFVVLAGDQPAALAFVEVDEPALMAANEMTGTLPEFRRRGLARLAKLATIQWAAQQGIRTMLTGNAHENVAMLRLNESLGYEPVLTETHFIREGIG
jgi:GNAT superfamily N-acetyltransferase